MNNMKKEYVKPEMLVEDILLEGMLAMSAMSGTDLGGNGDPFANKRQSDRGAWGNLWD